MSDSSIHSLKINQLQPNPFQPRERIKKEEIEELVASIREYGVLEPLVVAETPAGYQIIAGERRWRASKEIGLEEVPVVVKKTTPKRMLEMALVENVQRVDLNPLERAAAFKKLMQDFNFSVSDVAEKIAKSPSYISNSLKLLELPDAITDGLAGNQISEGHARALAGIEDEQEMVRCYKQILKEGASVRRAEELARRAKEGSNQPKTNRGRPIKQLDPRLESWEKQLSTYFSTPSSLKLTRTRKQTKITIVLEGNVQKTQEDLEKIMQVTSKK